jgi:coenzyme F420 hydrogenase subunit beta
MTVELIKRPIPSAASIGPVQGKARNLCTDCGISRTDDPGRCGTACQFIAPDYPLLERQVHGRNVNPASADEHFFGPMEAMLRARMTTPADGAQWTGITTGIAEALLRSGAVQAVLAMKADPDDRWKPEPVLITDADDLVQCRGMRMGYAPSLALLEPARAAGITKIAVIAIPCQVYALRALEKSLGFEELYVIGTPCSDNTTTENFHEFLDLLSDQPDTITYLEFRPDYHVELRFADGSNRLIPFLQLPISKLKPDFFPLTCRTCVDYSNRLADITVGYMGGSGDQWLIVRNRRGVDLLDLIANRLTIKPLESKGKRHGPVAGFKANTERAAGGLPLRAMPDWARPLAGWLMPKIGPKGLEFARSRIEMKAVETVLHLRALLPQRMKHMIPDHVWKLAAPYDLTPQDGERLAAPPVGAE